MPAVAESAVLLPLEKLLPAEWNANRVPPATMAKIRRSIERFGFVENLVARPHPTSNGKYEVVSGNHRLQICAEMGIDPAPVVVADSTTPRRGCSLRR
jgi:ParB family chromosome partitioning protein